MSSSTANRSSPKSRPAAWLQTWERLHLVSQYDGGIAAEDSAIGDLLEELRRLGLYDNTLVIVTGDLGALWRNSAVFDPARGALRAFLLGVTRNLALQRVRRDVPWEELDETSGLAGPIDLVGLERRTAIAAAVAALPPLQREALILAEYKEMSLDEIARATETELPGVKSRLHRARENLRRMLAPLLEKERTPYGTGR